MTLSTGGLAAYDGCYGRGESWPEKLGELKARGGYAVASFWPVGMRRIGVSAAAERPSGWQSPLQLLRIA